jgi:hypothetical protein
MTEPTYGSGQYDPGQGYSGGQGYGGPPPGHQYGGPGPQYGGQPGPSGPPPTGYQTGYPSGSTPLPKPTPARTPADRLALVANIVTIVGYACAGAGVLVFILLLTVDTFGSGTAKFAGALQALVTAVGLGALNVAAGTWLSTHIAQKTL